MIAMSNDMGVIQGVSNLLLLHKMAISASGTDGPLWSDGPASFGFDAYGVSYSYSGSS